MPVAEDGESAAMDVDETSEQQPAAPNQADNLQKFNMDTFLAKVKLQSEKPQNSQKLIKRSIKITNCEQLPCPGGSMVYLVREDGEPIIERFRLSL